MTKIKVLIVEDESIIAMELEGRLNDMGYEVAGTAADGETAVQIVESKRPDVALMDINIKGSRTGIEVAAEMRARFNIPVIYLTAYADEETLQLAKATSPYGYLLKPFRQDEIRAAISMAVHKHRTDAHKWELMVIDPMTGLYNRRYLDEVLIHEIHRAYRKKSWLSVVMLDVDRLKQINDTYGHEAGDTAIRTVSETIQLSLRKSDVVCRYGGDEIAILLPDTPLINAKNKISKIVEKISSEVVQVGDAQIEISVSAGIATLPDHADNKDDLMRSADKALYFSKHSGRNQVHGVDEIT